MTGFSSAGRSLPGLALTIELRSVNSRFLDLSLRVPDELRQFEAA
ncbi:MAG: YicC/YloC family endoribonuclease, partial [Betaproteobacteria bacterium]